MFWLILAIGISGFDVSVVDTKDGTIVINSKYDSMLFNEVEMFKCDMFDKIEAGSRLLVRKVGYNNPTYSEILEMLVSNYEVITNSSVNEMLEYEKNKETIGCDNIKCLSEIAGSYGVRYLININEISIDTNNTLFDISLPDIELRNVCSTVAVLTTIAGVYFIGYGMYKSCKPQEYDYYGYRDNANEHESNKAFFTGLGIVFAGGIGVAACPYVGSH
jgi:hypothetical protein